MQDTSEQCFFCIKLISRKIHEALRPELGLGIQQCWTRIFQAQSSILVLLQSLSGPYVNPQSYGTNYIYNSYIYIIYIYNIYIYMIANFFVYLDRNGWQKNWSSWFTCVSLSCCHSPFHLRKKPTQEKSILLSTQGHTSQCS